MAVGRVRRAWTCSAQMNLISSWFSDLGHHDAAGPRGHGHLVAIVVWTMMMMVATMGMMVGMVPMRLMVLSVVLVPRLRPIRLTGRI